MEATQEQQHEMTAPEPTQQHKWLQKLVGNWRIEGEAIMAPGQPPSKYDATESVRQIGDVWVLAESSSPGSDGNIAANLTTFGYDPAKQKFVGTFVSSMMTSLWVYEGDLQGDKLSFYVEGPSFSGNGTAMYRDEYEFLSDDHRTLISYVQQEDGSWFKFMEAHYYRSS